jgi:tetratricopeptide (TPR) repeat protein
MPCEDAVTPRSRFGYAAALAAAVATLLWYLPAVNHGFVNWDDGIYVTENRHLAPLGSAFLRWAFVDSREVLWHPLTWMSHALDVALWGLRPAGHHLTSVVLHALNTLLVCVLAQRLIEARAGNGGFGEPSRTVAALIAALLFGLHPIHVESVAWVAERKDVLSTFFYLGTLLAYLRYVGRRGEGERLSGPRFLEVRYLLCLGWFVLALLSKPIVITLPLAMLVLDWYPLGRVAGAGEARAALLEKLPFLALSAATVVIALGPSNTVQAAQAAAGAAFGKVLLACYAIAFYLAKMAWPTGLLPLYMHPQEVSLASPRFLVPLVAVIAISAACLGVARRHRVFAAAWAVYLVTLFPVLGIVQIGPHAVADRYAYISSIGPFLLCGLGAAWCWERASAAGGARGALRVATAGVCAAALGVLALLTARQIPVWEDSVTLWQTVIARKPDQTGVVVGDPWRGLSQRPLSGAEGNYIAHTNLGMALGARGRLDEAVEHYRIAIAIWPFDHIAHTNLGMALGARGRLDEAVEHFRTAVEIWPFNVRAHFNLAEIHVARGQVAEALEQYRRALDEDPSFYQARANYGVTLMGVGDLAGAETQLREALRLRSDDAISHFNLAQVLVRGGRYREAAREYREVLKGQPDDEQARANLDALQRAGLDR